MATLAACGIFLFFARNLSSTSIRFWLFCAHSFLSVGLLSSSFLSVRSFGFSEIYQISIILERPPILEFNILERAFSSESILERRLFSEFILERRRRIFFKIYHTYIRFLYCVGMRRLYYTFLFLQKSCNNKCPDDFNCWMARWWLCGRSYTNLKHAFAL